jgi:hypothetical protein
MEIKYRYDIINALIKKHNYKSFLEIGYLDGDTHNKVQCEYKDSVDINPKSGAKYIMSSDEFFKINNSIRNINRKRWDIIFIDGCHEYEHVKRDIENSLHCVNNNGSIVLHDCNPPNEKWQKWCGTVWKAIVDFRNSDYAFWSIQTVDVDCGVGIIRNVKGDSLNYVVETYSDFNNHRAEVLNLISVERFIESL